MKKLLIPFIALFFISCGIFESKKEICVLKYDSSIGSYICYNDFTDISCSSKNSERSAYLLHYQGNAFDDCSDYCSGKSEGCETGN